MAKLKGVPPPPHETEKLNTVEENDNFKSGKK